jgi:glycosyltransferase involved in cell wall biosynthesis
MRIMLFVHAFNGRAICDVASCLAEQTALAGHEVTLVAGTAEKGVSRPAGVRFVDLRTSSTRTWDGILRLRKVVRDFSPHALFAHGNGPARAAVIATRGLRDRPVVVTAEHNHYSSYPWRFRRVRDAMNRLLLPQADVVTGVAPEIVADLEELFPGVRGRTAMVPPPLTRWDRIAELAGAPVEHPWFEATDVPVVVSVANIHPRKDPETLVRAMVLLNERAVHRVRLVLIGRNSDPVLHAKLMRLAADGGIAKDVEFLGYQANPLAYVARASAFALTSLNEGMPIVILEAMALGTPVVSTDCLSGPRFLLQDGAYGELAPVGSPEGVAAGLLRVLEDPDRARCLRETGPKRVESFAPARIARRYLELVEPADA